MIKPLPHEDEEERINLLKSYHIIDSKLDVDFDNITRIAANICKAPIALISLLDVDRQWFKSNYGLNMSETPREYSFCGHAINQKDGLLIVEDARKDKRFYDNPLVIDDQKIVFYAGVVIQNEANLPFGTICIIDHKPRKINKNQLQLLKTLANQVNYLLENRKNKILLESTLKVLRKKNERLLKKENELKIIHKNIPGTLFQFVIEKNKTNYFTYISHSLKNIFPIKLPLNDIHWTKSIRFYPDDFEMIIEKLNQIDKNKKVFDFIGRIIVNDEIIWFEINSNIVFLNNKIVLDGIVKNITSRVNTENNLKKKIIFNELVLNNIPCDIALFDKDHNYLFINQYGIMDEELRKWMIGKNDFDYCNSRGLDNTLAQTRRNYFNQAITTKEQVDWIDEIIKDERKVYVFRRFYPVFIDGLFAYMIGYGLDVTELKETQNELFIQNQLLRDKNIELERFAYVASHDLQEPLLSLIGYSDLLENEYKDNFDDDGKLYINFIKKSASRMRKLITALMEYSRIEKKEEAISLDLNSLLNDVKDDLTNKIIKNNAKVTWDKLPELNCYPTFIRMMFQNLISNAIKFSSKNTIPEIKISYEERKTDWLFKIKDNGLGIDEKNFEDIFLIFKRLNNVEDYPGYGIGLAHCKKIAKIHNGNIWVESNKKKGSTFYFTISKHI